MCLFKNNYYITSMFSCLQTPLTAFQICESIFHYISVSSAVTTFTTSGFRKVVNVLRVWRTTAATATAAAAAAPNALVAAAAQLRCP